MNMIPQLYAIQRDTNMNTWIVRNATSSAFLVAYDYVTMDFTLSAKNDHTLKLTHAAAMNVKERLNEMFTSEVFTVEDSTPQGAPELDHRGGGRG